MDRVEKAIGKATAVLVMALCLTVLPGIGNPSVLAAVNQPGMYLTTGNTGPGNADAIQARINELDQKIAAVKDELKQLRQEMRSLTEQKHQLQRQKPQPPRDNSAEADALYRRQLAEWQSKMDALTAKINDKQQEINYKQSKLAALEKERARLQGSLNR